MSSTTPPQLQQGQIETPNPVELFWEKHRTKVLAGAGAVALGLIGVYGMEYLERQRNNELWSKVNRVSGLDRGYATAGSLAGLLGMDPTQIQFNVVSMYLNSTQAELLTRLGKDIGSADIDELRATITETKGSGAEPALLWVLANRQVQATDWDGALATLSDLEGRFPDHFLCASSDYPVQHRAEIEKPEEEEEAEANLDAEPELEAPVQGSVVSMLRKRIEAEREFRASHTAFYEAPAPDAEPTVVIKLSTEEVFKIRFYKDRAPEHVEAFLAKVRAGDFYPGQRIDQVERKPAQGAGDDWNEQFHFGLPASKNDDRSTWATERTKPSSVQLDFEDNDLSHFPGMLAAAKDTDGKSSGERVWVNVNDCATQLDGNRVIFGRVVEGLDALQRIVRESSFADEAMSNRGQGQLVNYITIESMEILDDTPPAKSENKPNNEGQGSGETGEIKTPESGKSEGGKPENGGN